jgi:hypothetical protein
MKERTVALVIAPVSVFYDSATLVTALGSERLMAAPLSSGRPQSIAEID